MSSIHQPEEIIQDKYRITGILGKGGVAVTYRAIALATNSPVAIKVISLKQLDNWKQVELFQREAEVLKQLNHSNIPDYIDYFDIETKTDKAFYLVQQLAPGKSLHQLVESGWRSNEKEVKNIAQQVLGILSYLHSLEPTVIHRDIKPHNLIRSDEGKIYLVDFGAVQNTYYNTLMQGSTVVGTYGYMAPEQFRGQALPATDLYSLGATLLYLLTHRSPAELPQDTLKFDFRSAVDISESFAEWLEKILEPDVEDRFNSAEVALAELLQGQKKNRKKLISSIGAGVLAIALVAGFNSYKWFFLNRFGFSPSNLSSHVALDNYLQEGGNINSVRDRELLNFLLHAIENKNIETQYIESILRKMDRDSISEYKAYSLFPRKRRSLIATAIIQKRYELVPLLINLGANVNYKSRYISPPIFEAISNNRLDIAQLLINNGAELNIKGNLGQHLLLHVFEDSKMESIKFLIDNNIDLDRKYGRGDTLLNKSINISNFELAQLLIKSGADVNINGASGGTPLFKAVEKNQFELVKLLLENNADVNRENQEGKNALFASKSSQIAQFLIDRGANVNYEDKKGSTPLFKAENYDIAKLFIDNGANVNHRNQEGSTPLFKAKDVEIAKLFIGKGVDINIENQHGTTALLSTNDKHIAELLIKHGANVNIKNKYDYTPLLQGHNLEFTKLLIKHGADIHAKDGRGSTLLIQTRNREIAELLIKLGADVNARNKYGRTPLSDAIESAAISGGDKELIQLLIDNGADPKYLNYKIFSKTHTYGKNYDSQIEKFLIENKFKKRSGYEINQ